MKVKERGKDMKKKNNISININNNFACIYSIGKLTIKGSGKLSVYGNQIEGEGIATETNDITVEDGNSVIDTVTTIGSISR